MGNRIIIGLVVIRVLALGGLAIADVFNMPLGQTSLQFVTVGIPGNPDDTRNLDHMRGGVDYTYNIGKCEVTAAQYTQFLNAVARDDSSANSMGLYALGMGGIQRVEQYGLYAYSIAPEYANRPVNWIDWGDATRFVNWLTNGQPVGAQGQASTTEDGSYVLARHLDDAYLMTVTRKPNARYVLPSDDEWHKAAFYDPNKPGGAGYWDYSTGTNTVPGRDMAEATNPGNNANYFGTPHPIESGTYDTTAVGQFSLSESPFGTFDQGGNLAEQTEGIISTSYRLLRGGDYSNPAGFMRASSSISIAPMWSSPTNGFRVVEVPEPATMGLLVIGGLALLRRQRI